MSNMVGDVSPGTFTEPSFTFVAGPYSESMLRVLSFRGREAVSRPYHVDLHLAAEGLDSAGFAAEVLGKPACLRLAVPGGEARAIHGVVSTTWAEGVLEQGRAALKVRLVPRFWALKKRRTSRIFQDKTVPAIVKEVLDEAGIPFQSVLLRKYPERVYCVEHQETDFAFVQRLLAEEGIFYVFEQTEQGEVMILADSAHTYPAIQGGVELAYRFGGGDGLRIEEHHVSRFALRRAVEPAAVLQRDYDFQRPTLDLRADAKHAANDVAPAHGEVYDHHGEDERPDVGAESAAIQLEQHRRRAVVAEGVSYCRRLSPGSRFTLADHDMGELNQEYVIASVEHRGRAPEIAERREHLYEASFTCALAKKALRPKRPRRRIQQVTETAVVVGPEGEEIHTDEHGRVKVQFHWDLAGKRDERSSCWIRVSQAWAGTHWGSHFVPRVGMEVVVTFLGGDTDRPLITGCVANAINPPPFKLPEGKTKSGVRTRSTPGGRGHNELSFEDAEGRELVYLRAERDMETAVGRDRLLAIQGNESIHVGRSRQVGVDGDHVRYVAGNEVVDIGKNLVMHVAGRQVIHVDGAAHDAPANAEDAANDSEDGGAGSGGGGGDVSDWSNKGNKDKVSMLDIKGGGIINSPDGLTLVGGGGSITIQNGKVTIQASEIEIKGGGEVKVEGHPIKLN